MKKTIWYISKYASPLKYGSASRHFYLAHEFNILGHDTVIVSSDSNHLARFPKFASVYTKERIDDVDTWWIRTTKYKGSASLLRIISWIDFEVKLWLMPKNRLPKPDVIIVSSLSLLTILNGYWFKKLFGCKLIFEIRDIWPLTLIEEGGFSRRNPFIRILAYVEKYGYRHADIIVGTMPNLAGHVKEITGEELNCYCIPQGFDPTLFENPAALPASYEECYFPQDKFIVGYAGRIGRTNALDTLLECARQLRDNPRIYFLLVGEGDLLKECREKTAGLSNIVFAPKLDKSQVQMFLKHCDVLYFGVENSRVWQYGLSLNKLIDYMYAGKFIIGSYSGYPSMLNEAQCGVFVPAKDVQALIEAITKCEQMPAWQLKLLGQKGTQWLLLNRPYKKLALEYTKLF